MKNSNDNDYNEIIYEYGDMILRISLGFLSRDDAEDIVQEVLIKYIEKKIANKIKVKEERKYWIAHITVNMCINELKKANNRLCVPLGEYENNMATEMNTSNEYEELLEVLTDKYKRIFVLHYINDYKISEISKIEKISEASVKKRLSRARNKIRSKLGMEVEP